MWKNRVAWLVWLLFAAELYFFENNTGTRILLVASMVVPLVSILCAVLGSKTVAVTVAAVQECRKGEDAACTVKAVGSRLLFGAVVRCRLYGKNLLTGEEQCCTLRIGGIGERQTRTLLRSAHCGNIRIRVEEAVTSDWFGLWRSSALRSSEEYLTVLPELFPVQAVLSESVAAAAEGERWSITRAGSDPSETFAIREYVPGDPIRQIHWKLSQKTDTMMLRELGLPVTEEILLLLETSFTDEPDAESVDLTMEALLSVSRALAEEGVAHNIVWKNRMLGEPELVTVRTEQEFDDAARLLLTASTAMDDEGIGACFHRWYPDRTYAHTAVFSPHPATDAVSLLGGGRVTLCLPESLCASQGSGGVWVAGVSRSMSYLEL